MADKEKYIGKRLSVDEICSTFPNKWAILSDYTDSIGGIVEDGILVDILNFEDMIKYMDENDKGDRKLYSFRTTENMNVGYIHGELIKTEDIGKN